MENHKDKFVPVFCHCIPVYLILQIQGALLFIRLPRPEKCFNVLVPARYVGIVGCCRCLCNRRKHCQVVLGRLIPATIQQPQIGVQSCRAAATTVGRGNSSSFHHTLSQGLNTKVQFAKRYQAQEWISRDTSKQRRGHQTNTGGETRWGRAGCAGTR